MLYFGDIYEQYYNTQYILQFEMVGSEISSIQDPVKRGTDCQRFEILSNVERVRGYTSSQQMRMKKTQDDGKYNSSVFYCSAI